MPKTKTSPPLRLALKPSKKLQCVNTATHSLAFTAALFNDLPWPLRFAVAGLVALDYWITFQRFRKENRIIQYSDRLGWRIANGGEFEGLEILPATVVTTAAIFLYSKDRPAQLIVHDALDEDDFRRLIVKLKLTAPEKQHV